MATIDRSLLDRVVAMNNNKGGVGKTTLAVNILGMLATNGWKVLGVDLDRQGNMANDLGYRGSEADDRGAGLAKALLFGDEPTPATVRPNLDVLPGGPQLDHASASLTQPGSRTDPRLALIRVLEAVQRTHGYDLVVIDCPPSNEVMQSVAAAAARYLLVPVKADDGSIEALELTAQRIDAVLDINPEIDLLGIILFDSSIASWRLREEFKEDIVAALCDAGASDSDRARARATIFDSFMRHAESPAHMTRRDGLLAQELDTRVRQQAPKRFERLRAGLRPERTGPKSSRGLADDVQAITEEFVTRLTEREAARGGS